MQGPEIWLLLLAATPWRLLCQESCPVGVSSAACGATAEGAGDGAGVAATSKDDSPAASTSSEMPRATLLAQEIEELESFIQLGKVRVGLLQELREALQSEEAPAFPEPAARSLREKLPLMSELTTEADAAPTAASEDYLISKAVIPQQDTVGMVRFLPLRSPRVGSSSSAKSSQGDMPSALLIAAQTDGAVRLFTPAGEMVLSFSTGHEHPVTQLASSLSHDEYLVVTGDASGGIRVHKITVRQRRLSKEEKKARRATVDEKVSQYMSSPVNVTAQLQRQMQLPVGDGGVVPRMTALSMASQGGTKYFVTGDDTGKVSIFTKNGTLRAQLEAAAADEGGVQGLHSQLSSLIFKGVSRWGYVDLEKMEVRPVTCPFVEGRVTAASLDSQQASRVLLADEAGTVSIFSVKNKKECTLELRFPSAGVPGSAMELASIRGFALALERAASHASVQALNMSHVGKRKGEPSPPPQSVVWRRNRPPTRAWAAHKRYQQGDLLAFLSEDGTEIEIMELLMVVHSAPAQDNFSNFKMPVIAVAVVLVLGYQYMKQKGKFGGGKKPDFGGRDFRSALLNKRKAGGLSALRSKRF